MNIQILPLDARSYVQNALHRGERAWLETNCYVDLWIEVLHAFGHDPHASLAFTVGLDFEGDQWLFFKQPTRDLLDLYGVDVQELNIWRDLLGHVVEQVSRGRIVLVEVDAFHLPDTAGVSYRSGHSKTTIGIQRIDREAQKLGYFHNAGYFELEGEDFAAIFGVGREPAPDYLPPYTEFAKLERAAERVNEELVARSVSILTKHLARSPNQNPVTRFRERFERDLVWLSSEPNETFHKYAFSTLRQCGACYELAASYMHWLGDHGESGLEVAAQAFDTLASQSKALQFKTARAVMLKRPVDFTPMLSAMELAWSQAMSELQSKYLRASATCIVSAE